MFWQKQRTYAKEYKWNLDTSAPVGLRCGSAAALYSLSKWRNESRCQMARCKRSCIAILKARHGKLPSRCLNGKTWKIAILLSKRQDKRAAKSCCLNGKTKRTAKSRCLNGKTWGITKSCCLNGKTKGTVKSRCLNGKTWKTAILLSKRQDKRRCKILLSEWQDSSFGCHKSTEFIVTCTKGAWDEHIL